MLVTEAAAALWQAAAREPGDFEATYNHALALQELASHTVNRADEQMQLLQQVRFATCGPGQAALTCLDLNPALPTS